MSLLNMLMRQSGVWWRRACGQEAASSSTPDAQLIDGKAHAQACELPIVRHCNLSCRSCSHLSPAFPRHLSDPAQLRQDLTVLSRHYHVRCLRVMGGEPLLHPHLLEILAIARDSRIADRVRLVTNGLLLPRQAEAVWRNLDEVEISVYPRHQLTPTDLTACQRRADQWGVRLRLKYFDRFRETHAELGTDDDLLVQRIYRTCNIAHAWSCHNVDEGYFYKCPASIMLPRILDAHRIPPYRDGLKIRDTLDFAETLVHYLCSRQPLAACRYCLGTAGKLFDHEQVPRKHWRDPQRRTTEALLDLEFLKVLEETPGSPWICTRGDLDDPRNARIVQRLRLRGMTPASPSSDHTCC